ncbi:phage portal protein [Micromonospora aurantiaca (nom. illeg.)]|uniref:phage portal protein n=1 Tax=Micromonospora aurantiaca (nom. illeg.) TaxID=47850 RepID=UPI003F49EEF4
MSVFFRSQPAAVQKREMVPFGAHRQPIGSGSYAGVTLNTAESSLQSIAVRAAVDLIASLGSELPGHVYSGSGADRRQRSTPGYLEDPAGDGNGLADWAYQVLVSWLLRGNLYGDILDTSAQGGYPTQVALHHPDCVGAWLNAGGEVQWTVNGRAVTEPERFLHRRVNPVPGRVQGLSPIEYHAAQIGLTLTATRYGLQWFREGAHPSAMLISEDRTLSPEQAKTAKARFMAALFGTREPIVMDSGWKYQAIQVSAEESQFLQTQGYTEAQCARIFGPGIGEVLGYESGGSMTYANVESRSAHLLVYSLNKWLRRLERLIGEMLPRGRYWRIDRDALLQSTTLERYRAHESALKNNWKRINEVRADEDMPPVPWGDEPYAVRPAPADDPDKDDPTGAEAPKKDGT